MERIPLTPDAVGRKLARDLLDGQGRTVLAAGVELTADHCRMLARRGIEEVMVHESEADAGQQEADELAREAREETENPAQRRRIARVQHMFADVMDSETMQHLFRLALEFAKKGIVRG